MWQYQELMRQLQQRIILEAFNLRNFQQSIFIDIHTIYQRDLLGLTIGSFFP